MREAEDPKPNTHQAHLPEIQMDVATTLGDLRYGLNFQGGYAASFKSDAENCLQNHMLHSTSSVADPNRRE